MANCQVNDNVMSNLGFNAPVPTSKLRSEVDKIVQ